MIVLDESTIVRTHRLIVMDARHRCTVFVSIYTYRYLLLLLYSLDRVPWFVLNKGIHTKSLAALILVLQQVCTRGFKLILYSKPRQNVIIYPRRVDF